LLGDSIKIGRRGSLSGRVTVSGVQGHVAYPEKANNPLPVLARLVGALDMALDEGTAHFSPSNLEITSIDVGDGVANLIPAAGSFRFNIRYNDLWTPQTLSTWVRERLAGVEARGTEIKFEIVGRPSRAFLSPASPDTERLGDAIAA